MKKLFTLSLCSLALAIGAFAQSPSVPPPGTPAVPSVSASASATISPAESISPAPSATGSPSLADKIHNKINQKLNHKKGVHFNIGDDDEDTVAKHVADSDIPALAIPLVGIVMITIFGAPVLIVAVILYFGFSKNRMMHRTVRMMVEKGQPVPAALLNPPPHVRKRSDMRRGVVLCMIGAGLMIFLAAVNEGEGGAWAIGVIPFLIGAGYLLVWKLEGKGDVEAKADNPPPLP
jgi:Domain of unknown function (DUF6249)